jgi:hypothetical protein
MRGEANQAAATFLTVKDDDAKAKLTRPRPPRRMDAARCKLPHGHVQLACGAYRVHGNR